MTKNLLESGLLTEVNGHYETTGPLPQLAIPTTLQDSFASRLDRLAPVRELAQIGAVLGREFSYELIRAVAKLDEPILQAGLQQLGDAEILYQRGVPPEASYSFKHALLQDASYESLLKSKRQQLHTQTAQVMEQQFLETVEIHPELVAHHYTEATLSEQAIPYWQRAGSQAEERSAYIEAIHHLTTGLDLLKMVPESPDRDRQELSLLSALGNPTLATKGFGAPELEANFGRARALCQQVGQTAELIPVLHGLRMFYTMRTELQTAYDLNEQIFHVAQDAEGEDQVWVLCGYHAVASEVAFYRGEIARAREHHEKAVALYNPELHRPKEFAWADLEVATLSNGALFLWYLGYPDRGAEEMVKALTVARELGHPFSLGLALGQTALFHGNRRDWKIAQETAEEMKAVAAEHGLVNWSVFGMMIRGWALTAQGRGEEGLEETAQGMSDGQASGIQLFGPFVLSIMAQGYGQIGKPEDGLNMLAMASAMIEQTGERWYEAGINRTQGELLLQQSQDNIPEAEATFQKALDVSRHQQAKSLELRAATSLAHLWQQQGKKTEAHALLAPVYNWFTEGFDTQDLKDAKALLDELTQNT